MECACISADVNEFCEVLFDKHVQTRKSYRCGECGRAIAKGETCRLEKTVFEGEFNTHRTCIDCCSVREHLVCSFYYGAIWELVSEEIQENPFDLPWSKIGRLTPAARAKVCEWIEKEWGEIEDQ